VFIYENKTMKPTEIVLRRGKEDKGKKMEGMNLIKIKQNYLSTTKKKKKTKSKLMLKALL
jgi:hypothetical protein